MRGVIAALYVEAFRREKPAPGELCVMGQSRFACMGLSPGLGLPGGVRRRSPSLLETEHCTQGGLARPFCRRFFHSDRDFFGAVAKSAISTSRWNRNPNPAASRTARTARMEAAAAWATQRALDGRCWGCECSGNFGGSRHGRQSLGR